MARMTATKIRRLSLSMMFALSFYITFDRLTKMPKEWFSSQFESPFIPLKSDMRHDDVWRLKIKEVSRDNRTLFKRIAYESKFRITITPYLLDFSFTLAQVNVALTIHKNNNVLRTASMSVIHRSINTFLCNRSKLKSTIFYFSNEKSTKTNSSRNEYETFVFVSICSTHGIFHCVIIIIIDT